MRVLDARIRLGGRPVLRGVDLEAGAGCVTGLLGANGAGKSTTIRLLLGLLVPDSGTVEVLGSAAPRAVRRRVGYLPEERGLYRRMRVRDFLAYVARLRGLRKAAVARAVDRTIEEFALGPHRDKRCEALSKGLGQRVQLAATLLHDPQLLILDEPFSGLDPAAADRLVDRLAAHRAAGRTLLLATHQLELAERICDRVVLIAEGRTVLSGTPEGLRRSAPTRIALRHRGGPAPSLPEVAEVRAPAPDRLEVRLPDNDRLPEVLRALVGALAVTELSVREATLGDVIRARLGATSASGPEAGDPAIPGAHGPWAAANGVPDPKRPAGASAEAPRGSPVGTPPANGATGPR